MQRIKFDQGEIRHVRVLIHSTNGEPFAIRNARWELMLGRSKEAEGAAVVEDHCIDCFVAPKAAQNATYGLRVIYEIADETLVETIEVVVT